MTRPAPFPIRPLLAGMADAMEEIRQMLLRYEEAMVEAPRDATNRRAAQEFDLAVQILQDLEYVATLLAGELPPDLMADIPMPLTGVRLERNRRRFITAAQGGTMPPPEHAPRIDLFVRTNASEDDRPRRSKNGPLF